MACARVRRLPGRGPRSDHGSARRGRETGSSRRIRSRSSDAAASTPSPVPTHRGCSVCRRCARPHTWRHSLRSSFMAASSGRLRSAYAQGRGRCRSVASAEDCSSAGGRAAWPHPSRATGRRRVGTAVAASVGDPPTSGSVRYSETSDRALRHRNLHRRIRRPPARGGTCAHRRPGAVGRDLLVGSSLAARAEERAGRRRRRAALQRAWTVHARRTRKPIRAGATRRRASCTGGT